MTARCRIALHGYAGVGKDVVVGEHLIKKRRAFGDIIKADLDEEIRAIYGFSAFTEDRSQKALIRDQLVKYGYDHSESIERRFFEALPERCVNTRILRPRECKLWKEAGGVIILVTREGYKAAEPKEEEEVLACWHAGLISYVLANNGTPEECRIKLDYFMTRILSGLTP